MRPIRPTVILVVAHFLALFFVQAAAPLAAHGEKEPVDEASDASDALDRLFADEWAWRLREDPITATFVGEHAYGDRLPSMAAADLARRDRETAAFLARLEAIPLAELGAAERISYAVFARELRERREAHAFGEHEIPLNADSGFHTTLAMLVPVTPFATAEDYRAYIARLRAFPRYFAEQIALMRQGLERGWTLPQVVLRGIDEVVAGYLAETASDSVFHPPFASFGAGVPELERPSLEAAGASAIRDAVVPAYRDFLAFLTEEYIPGARTTLGAYDLPGGEAYYAQRIRVFTTLDDVDAEHIHELGKREVARIRAEMETIVERVGFAGDFAAFLTFLRTDPRFYAETPEQLLKEAAWIAKRMDAALPKLFGKLPRQPYGVAPVPDAIAPKYTGGRYVDAPPGGTEPGWYWVNTYALDSRPLYVLEALTLHEAVPGHHLQIALAQEQEDLPAFRRAIYHSGFGEGWGLYSERLGLEAGFYTDPYSDFGRLTYEMWRACRLVVDTGLHAFGWSRERAMRFLAENTALSLHEVETETDRYISWPGQALAYKMGELTIRRLRRQAEEALGPRFDIRAFHDAVLANGSIPLALLEQVIDEHIESRRH